MRHGYTIPKTLAILLVLLVGIVAQPVSAQASIPAGATIDSATLLIFVREANDQTVNVHRITAPWTETGVTWNSFGGSYDPAVAESFVAGSAGQQSIDVTALVQSWVDGTYPNYGLLIEQSGLPFHTYLSSEDDSTNTRPRLDICYTAENAGSACVSIQRPGLAQDGVADTYIWERSPDYNAGTVKKLYTGIVNGGEKQSLFRFDFDIIASAALGDYVWEDLNANGIQDPNELDDGINGVQVELLCDDDGNFNVVNTTTTADNPFSGLPGWYKFDVTPGVACKVAFVNPDPDGPDAYMFSPRQVGGDPAVDSDGPTSDLVTLGPGEFDPTLDAGLFRKGSIHVFGYLDRDGNGSFDLEDEAFADNPGKRFELLDQNGAVIRSGTTVGGMVWFEGLTPGTYSVRENPVPDGYELTTLPNERTYTIQSGEELVYKDGAAMLPSGDQRFETNLGDGLRWGNTRVPECDLVLDKKCLITPPPTEDLLCSDKIVATTLRYTGPSTSGVAVEVDPDKGPTVVYSNVDLVSGATVLTMPAENGFTVDARPDESELGSKTTIRINGVEEVIHTSCSAPYVAGQPAPLDDPKGDPSPNWLVESFVDKDSPAVVRVLVPPEPSDACSVTLGPVPSCETEDRPKSLTFVVSGGDCPASANTQGDKFKCTDEASIDPNVPFEIVYTGKDPDKITISPATVYVGEQFTLEATGRSELHSNSKLEISQHGALKQKLEIHTSCSAPLELGDVFGALKLVEFDGQGAGAQVTYFYEVTNNGAPTDVTLEDSVNGMIVFSAGPFSLGEGETQPFQWVTVVDGTTTNTATVVGDLGEGGGVCQASDEVTVTVEEPPPGPQVCTTKVQAMSLRYTGSTPLANVEFDPDKGDSVTYAAVNPGDTLSLPIQNDWTIDATTSGEEELGAKTKILVDGILTEIIHTSCSAPFTAGAPAPLDGGSPAVPGTPDPDKGDPSPNWFVESFQQKP